MPLFGAPQSDNGQKSPSQTPIAENTVTARQEASKPSPATIIAKGVRLEGEFMSQGDVQIEGEVLGTVETSAMLSVGSSAKVKAGVKANDAVIAGEVDGNVQVKGKLELKSTAKIIGEIKCSTIVVESGAKMQGNVICGQETEKQQAQKPEISKTQTETAGKNQADASKPVTT